MSRQQYLDYLLSMTGLEIKGCPTAYRACNFIESFTQSKSYFFLNYKYK